MCNSSSIKDQSGYKVTCSIINSTSKLQSLSTCATYLHLSTKIFFNLYNAYTMKTKKKNDWSIGRRKHAILGWAMSFKILAADRPLRSTHPVVITHQNLSAPNPNVKIRNHHVLLHTPNPYVQIRITTTISSPKPSCNTLGVCHSLSSEFELKYDRLSEDDNVKVHLWRWA
jgi:hypothetical protein